MNVSVGARWEEFVENLVREGRYGSASEIVREGLRLVEEREEKLNALRDHLNRAIERGGSHTDEEVAASVRRRLDALKKEKRSA
ncbi:type II toxin-antitoxin system ParD family antitoxin [Methylopila sp. M107]|uniref:type II toxin-antitoxin system ParD family antitoxin n=1 Tax=Methylopila sp. M107 TaxID=1101190 RepID=UPI0003652EB7|nr:type II toxin-antitoxin system ParD family antitoxin [Methylopila sp. M107]